MACFEEKVQCKDAAAKGKIEDRWPEGISVGKTFADACHIVLTPDGARTSRAIARALDDRRWDAD